jgi:hypothetical protein
LHAGHIEIFLVFVYPLEAQVSKYAVEIYVLLGHIVQGLPHILRSKQEYLVIHVDNNEMDKPSPL